MLEIIECIQNSPEWYEARLGCATTSKFKDIMAKGKGTMRRTHMLKLAGERITGTNMPHFYNAAMARGHEHEPIIKALYEERTFQKVDEVGFIKNGSTGCSPDGLIGIDGMVEYKSKEAHLQAELLLSDKLPTEHKAQVYGALMIAERQWIDFVSYCPGMPLYIKKIEPNLEYFKELKAGLNLFEKELQEIVELLMSKF